MLLENAIISDSAIDYIINECQALISKDFVGYLILFDKKIGILIDLNLRIIPFYLDNRFKKLSARKINKVIKGLIKSGFIVDSNTVIFPELKRYRGKLPFIANKADIINDYILSSPLTLPRGFKADDSVDDVLEDTANSI